jgi:hypothetical protein
MKIWNKISFMSFILLSGFLSASQNKCTKDEALKSMMEACRQVVASGKPRAVHFDLQDQPGGDDSMRVFHLLNETLGMQDRSLSMQAVGDTCHLKGGCGRSLCSKYTAVFFKAPYTQEKALNAAKNSHKKTFECVVGSSVRIVESKCSEL